MLNQESRFLLSRNQFWASKVTMTRTRIHGDSRDIALALKHLYIEMTHITYVHISLLRTRHTSSSMARELLNTGQKSDNVQAFFHLACSCVHGRCNQGPSGDGSCECDVGWKGVKCDRGKSEPLRTYDQFFASLFGSSICFLSKIGMPSLFLP